MTEPQNGLLTQFLGWGAAIIPLATLTRQVYAQWRGGNLARRFPMALHRAGLRFGRPIAGCCGA